MPPPRSRPDLPPISPVPAAHSPDLAAAGGTASDIVHLGGEEGTAAAQERDRNKASLLFAAQRQLELRGRELSMLAVPKRAVRPA